MNRRSRRLQNRGVEDVEDVHGVEHVAILPLGNCVFPRDLMTKILFGNDAFGFYSVGSYSGREGGHLHGRMISQYSKRDDGRLCRLSLAGVHTLLVVVGTGELAIAFLNGLYKATKTPEVAILLMKSDKEVRMVEKHIKQNRLWPNRGFVVFMLGSGKFVQWPTGKPPEIHEAEFMEVRVTGSGAMNCGTENGLPNRLYSKDRRRGVIELAEKECLTFWHVVVTAGFEDDPMYEELHIKEGLDKGYVTVLKDTEQMKTVLNERVEYLEKWLSPDLKRGLARRDDFLRKHGFPDNPQWGTFVNGVSKSPVDVAVPIPEWAKKFKDMYNQPAPPEPECNFDNFYRGRSNLDIYCHVPGLEEPCESWNETLKKYASLAPVIDRTDPDYCDYLFY